MIFFMRSYFMHTVTFMLITQYFTTLINIQTKIIIILILIYMFANKVFSMISIQSVIFLIVIYTDTINLNFLFL